MLRSLFSNAKFTAVPLRKVYYFGSSLTPISTTSLHPHLPRIKTGPRLRREKKPLRLLSPWLDGGNHRVLAASFLEGLRGLDSSCFCIQYLGCFT
jgi:hypothetical protein